MTQAKPRLAALGRRPGRRRSGTPIRANLGKFDDVATVGAGVVNGPVDAAGRRLRASSPRPPALLPESWANDLVAPGPRRSKEKTGAKGKALFLPLRRALTGQDHGPEMGAAAAADRPLAGERTAVGPQPDPRLVDRCATGLRIAH